jgi:UDP-N-acetylmuramate: L-alanyl-gamma-D-glutamyl-meso-diaminopimelate ligase
VEHFASPEGWEAGQPDGEGAFEVSWRGRALGRLRLALPGAHSRDNALAAIAAARHAGVEPVEALSALAAFGGVKRRMELKGTAGGVAVYDDFAHHPTAIRTTLEGFRQREKGGRILAVFDPRSNTMKKGVLKDALPASFGAADRVYIHAAGLEWDAATVFAPLGGRARCEPGVEALVAAIAAEAEPGDRVLVMSNGGFGGIHGKLLAALGDRRC